MKFESILISFIFIGTVDGCLSGWLRHGNKCYHFSHDTEPWIGAVNMCKLFGGNLVNIETATENSYLAATAKLRGHYYWIGLTDAQEESIWRWISNTGKLVYSGYFHWASGEPNNTGSDENCAALRTSGFWNDSHCTNNLHYICEADNSDESIVG